MSQYIPAGSNEAAAAAYLYGKQQEPSPYTGKVDTVKLAGLAGIGVIAFLIWAARQK